MKSAIGTPAGSANEKGGSIIARTEAGGENSMVAASTSEVIECNGLALEAMRAAAAATMNATTGKVTDRFSRMRLLGLAGSRECWPAEGPLSATTGQVVHRHPASFRTWK